MGSRAFWFKHLRQWHWVSSAACFAGMLLFSITGITLNHAADIPARSQVTHATAVLPEALRTALARTAAQGGKSPVPAALAEWARGALSVRLDGREAEWSEGEVYVSLPRAGGDAWLTADLETGEARYEKT
ncbi:MAG: PepSY-associated TM helix domain-containing protein, partial [Vicinamibacteria bacterium]